MICVRFIFSSIFVLAVWIQGRSALLEDEVLFQNLNKIDKRYDLITPGRTYGFCKPPVPRSFLQIWSRSYIQFENADLVDVMYTGASEDEVRNGLKTWFPTQYMLLSHSLFRSKELNVPLFGNFCVALKPNEPTIFYLRYDQFAFRSLLMFIAGLIVFFTADFFSRQLQTFYFFGASFGAIGGCILLCFILKRFLPKQSGFIWYLFSGLFNFYILNKSRSLMFTYPYYLYLASYLVVAGFIGFGVAYYYGKSFDPRMYDIIRWVIRSAGLILVGLSTEFVELGSAICLAILTYHNFPTQKVAQLKMKLKAKFFKPKPRKFLTEKEYEMQTKLTTEKALEDLRRFCNSPECRKWTTIKKLNDPKRFAAFASGEDHVSVDELTAHTFDLSHFSDDEC